MEINRLENSPVCYYTDDSAGGEWAVFVHAAFVDSRMFEKQFEYFKGKYNLLAVDVVGHGQSVAKGKVGGVENMAGWIAEIMDRCGICAAHFVGVSLGAVIIQDFANRFSDRVLSLACFGGYDINRFDEKAQKDNAKGQRKMLMKAFVSLKWFAKANKKISAYTEDGQEEFYKLNLGFKPSSMKYLAGMEKIINKFPPAERAYPLLIGCGGKDIAGEIDIVNKWAETERCEKVIIEGAGHCANLDKPSEFNAALEKFWNTCYKAHTCR